MLQLFTNFQENYYFYPESQRYLMCQEWYYYQDMSLRLVYAYKFIQFKPHNPFITMESNLVNERNTISKAVVYGSFAISVIAWQLSLALAILLGAQGYVGFDGSFPMTATCTATYFTTKQAALIQMTKTAFIGSIVALATITTIFVIMLIWTIRVCRQENANSLLTSRTKIVLYLLSNLSLLAEIAPCGYYFTHLVQLHSCTSTYNSTQITVIFAFAAFLLFVTLIFWFVALRIIFLSVSSGEKYRDVSSQPTEPAEKQVQQPIKEFYYRQPSKNSSPIRRLNQEGNLQHTKENMFESPSRSPQRREAQLVYSNNDKLPQVYTKFNEVNRHQTNQRSIQESAIDSKYMPPESSHQISPPKNQAQLNRINRRMQGDEVDFQMQQNRFMGRYQGGSILPTRGVQQRQTKQKKLTSDIFPSQPPKRRFNNSPDKNISRQGALVSHIRGKYAN